MRRRVFLGGVGLVGMGSAAPAIGAGLAAATFEDGGDESGVASGEPAPNAVTIWTRVPGAVRSGADGVDVRWYLSSDDREGRAVRRTGVVRSNASRDWTVKVRVEGLDPDCRYVYGFLLEGGDWRSVQGMARTLPPEGADLEGMTFAYVSCQYFGTGFYTVYRALAQDARIDFCIHLGDSIYESTGGKDKIVRVRPDSEGEAFTVDDYRERYRRTLSDPWYREVRRRFTWICLPDDHECYNDYFGTDMIQADRRRGAMTAYFEYTPIDDALYPRLHRAFRFGRLATLFALDERQYRDGPVCPSGGVLKQRCEAAVAPERTMLGSDQRAWLDACLATSETRWNVMLSEVLLMPQRIIDRPVGVERAPLEDLLSHSPLRDTAWERGGQAKGDAYLTLDSWDGYPSERASLLDGLASAGKGNTLVWTGDIHNMYAGYLRSETIDVGFEMSTGSVTSFGVGDVFPFGSARIIEAHLMRENRHYVTTNLRKHMYVRCTLRPDSAVFETVCAHSVRRPDAGASVEEVVHVARGTLEVRVDRV